MKVPAHFVNDLKNRDLGINNIDLQVFYLTICKKIRKTKTDIRPKSIENSSKRCRVDGYWFGIATINLMGMSGILENLHIPSKGCTTENRNWADRQLCWREKSNCSSLSFELTK